MVRKEQVYDLYIAGYEITEISHICNCSERTIRRKLKEIRDEKQEEELNRLKLLGVSIEVINDNKKKVRYKRVYNKNEIIKSYLDGYTAREIEDKYGYFRDEVYNIIRNLKRKIGFSKFKELYEKIHNLFEINDILGYPPYFCLFASLSLGYPRISPYLCPQNEQSETVQ